MTKNDNSDNKTRKYKKYHTRYFAILKSLQQNYIYILNRFLHPQLTAVRNARVG